jgi:outer membrane lipoprotein SlyB
MANTFKVCTIADVAVDSGTFSTLYTVAGSTTTVILGLSIANKINAARTVTVKLTSDTGNRTGANDAANQNVTLLNQVSIPADTTLEVFAGQKIVMETTDVLTIGASAGSSLDATLSIMEIT